MFACGDRKAGYRISCVCVTSATSVPSASRTIVCHTDRRLPTFTRSNGVGEADVLRVVLAQYADTKLGQVTRERAMVEIERSGQASVAADQVWAALSDFADISRWAPSVDHSCLMTDQSTGVGTTRRIQAGRFTLIERVTQWESDALLTYSIEGLPPVVQSLTNTWRLRPEVDHTHIGLTATLDTGARPPQQLIGRGLGRRLASTNEQMLDGLIAHLEQQAVV